MFASGKRSREENEVELDQMRMDRKKPRTLPFRTSPTTKHTSLFSQCRQLPRAPVLTPAESSEDESDDGAMSNRGPKLPSHLLAASLMHMEDSDLDMEDSQPLGSPLWSSKLPSSPMNSPLYRDSTSLPVKAVARVQQLLVSNTRIPTPIYGHFQLSPQDVSMDTPTSPAHPEPASKLGTLRETQHDLFVRRRRLPSPISEDENMESPTAVTGGMLRKLDMTAHHEPVYPPDIDMMTPVTPSTTNLGYSEWRDKRRGAFDGRSAGHRAEQPSTPGKVVLSMGFKADCEKCRSRVPGHYSHLSRV
ncbi:hypothetical protein MMC26_004967 [Xylographa opegraphella]|nr:hypothetical protein [Xylographa opegraphella]